MVTGISPFTGMNLNHIPACACEDSKQVDIIVRAMKVCRKDFLGICVFVVCEHLPLCILGNG